MAASTVVYTWVSPTECVIYKDGVLVDWVVEGDLASPPPVGSVFTSWENILPVDGVVQPHRIYPFLGTGFVGFWKLETYKVSSPSTERPPLHMNVRADALRAGGAAWNRRGRNTRQGGLWMGHSHPL